jgi:hypothetical protein
MAAKPEDVIRVVEFRNRLVAFANYIDAHRPAYGEELKPAARQHIGTEQTGLGQDYGRVYNVIKPYGIASMTQYGGIVSQDVVRDAIGRLDHPSYPALAQMAIQHLDVIIGHLRAEVEDEPANGRTLATEPPDVRDWGFTSDDVYRVTSLVYWLGKLVGLIGWLLSTTRGRIAAITGAVALAIIGGVVSGAAQAWFEQFLNGSRP